MRVLNPAASGPRPTPRLARRAVLPLGVGSDLPFHFSTYTTAYIHSLIASCLALLTGRRWLDDPENEGRSRLRPLGGHFLPHFLTACPSGFLEFWHCLFGRVTPFTRYDKGQTEETARTASICIRKRGAEPFRCAVLFGHKCKPPFIQGSPFRLSSVRVSWSVPSPSTSTGKWNS